MVAAAPGYCWGGEEIKGTLLIAFVERRRSESTRKGRDEQGAHQRVERQGDGSTREGVESGVERRENQGWRHDKCGE